MEPFDPAKARARVPRDTNKKINLDDPNWIAEEKIDGSRYLLYLGSHPYDDNRNSAFLSRRHSAKDGLYVDKAFQVPHIATWSSGDPCAVLDGEIRSPDGFGNTVSIMNSHPAEAIRLQEAKGYVEYHVFDILSMDGRDITHWPLRLRRQGVVEVLRLLDSRWYKPVPELIGNRKEHFERLVNAGGEGLMLKDVNAVYGKGWAKIKKKYDVSGIITGFIPGEGKYEGQIGSLCISVYCDNELIEIATAGGFDDSLRLEISQNFDDYKGRVVDVWAQEITSGDRLRHPRFYRFRDDMDPSQCTWENVLEAFKNPIMDMK